MRARALILSLSLGLAAAGHALAGVHLGLVFDTRHHHDHAYPGLGQHEAHLPSGALGLRFGGRPYYVHGGVWFRPFGHRFLVVAPPVGIVVPVLPPAYVTLTLGGFPYYYANRVYYRALPGQGYEVVAPPPGAESAGSEPARTAPAPVVYPRSGQTPEQTETDHRDCNRWATTQPEALADAQVFQRAVAACMDARGYTLK